MNVRYLLAKYHTVLVKLLAVAAAISASLIISACGAAPKNLGSLPLQFVRDYPLPGATTRWDYLSLDPGTAELFIAHLGDSAVVVMNTRTKAVVATIGGIGHVHGILAVPESGRVYASATQTNAIVVIDAATLKIIARIPGGIYPDGMAYAPDVGKLYVSDESGNTETVIDVRSNRRIATIQLGGNVGNTQYDPVSGHIFVNVQGRDELVEVDPTTDTIIERIALPGANANHGLLIEPKLRLAFIACEGNDRLLVLNLKTKKVISSFSVGKGPDVLAYDAEPGFLYVASESGVLTMFKASTEGVTKIGEGFVGTNAHSVAVDPSSHEIYLPLKDIEHHSVMRVMKPSL